jgi:hypothetical protein
MKKFISLIILTVCLCVSAKAQVIILNDNILQGRMSEIRTTVLDSLTNEPVAYASVYVTPSKDTTITNFTLTDDKGVAKLDEVPYGSYVFHVEMMGYVPYVKERYFRNEVVDLGTIRLKVDEHFLQAATVSAVGNPIVVKKDTVEFNASSFRVGANAMLKDLLMRMPGMEITADGKVKFNGQEIDKLTVGGKTFFFNDQSTALNNLPAAVVDKIRVIDRESEATRASGIQDGNRETVLDVALKKEYEKGLFGNVGLKGGTTLGDKNPEELRDDRGLLYSGNVLVSAYNEKDQATFIGNVQNVDDSGVVFVLYTGDDETSIYSTDQGLTTSDQLAFNVNTTRIKDVETTVGANAKYADTVSGASTERTTYQDGGNLTTSSENRGRQFMSSTTGNLEMKKENGKVWFHFRPEFHYERTDAAQSGSSKTSREGAFVNSSDNATHNLSENKNAALDADVTFRDLWGKKKRSIGLDLWTNYAKRTGNSDESSVLTLIDSKESRMLHYDNDGFTSWLDGTLRYTEPLNEKWLLSWSAELSWNQQNNDRLASDQAGRNEYYSSQVRSSYVEQEYDMTAQYSFGEGSYILFGGKVIGSLNRNYSKTFNVESVTGEDAWNWFVSPRIRFQYNKGNDRVMFNVNGYGNQPSPSRMRPVLDISNPSRVSVGNLYLKPYCDMNYSVNWTRNNREKFSTLMFQVHGETYFSPIIQAQWYDKNGILYSVPVNARKPRFVNRIYLNYTTPLDEKKLWTMTLGGNLGYSSAVSYQARTVLPGLDKDTFDYSTFIADFWGPDGNRFYNGDSGFAESLTRTFTPAVRAEVKFNQERFSFSLGGRTQAYIARYSLDPNANMNTTNTSFEASGSYTTKHEFEFNTDLGYYFFKGYAEGYGQPEWRWNADINKSVGPFVLSVKLYDILNQKRNLTHTITANYEEDTCRLIMGRYVLFGVKWNFGKMNAVHSQRAENLAWDMLY